MEEVSSSSNAGSSFGVDLPDQYTSITEAVAAHVVLAQDVSSYLRERAALEREYAAKLKSLIHKMKEKLDKRSALCTVGPDPAKPWAPEMASRSSIHKHLSSVALASRNVAEDHNRLGEVLEKVAADVATVGRRGEDMRRKHNAFRDKVVADRDHVYHDRCKAKARYDENCHNVDSHRQKKEKAEAEGKHGERFVRSHAEAQAEMFDAKNAYLVAVEASVRAKQRFFRKDLPRLEDDLQFLWTLIDRRMVSHLQRASEQMASHSEDVAEKHRRAQLDADQVDIPADERLFIEFNLRRYEEPADFAFEPCQGFFDTAEPSMEPSAKIFLQNMLIRKHRQISEIIPLVNSKAKEIQGLENLRDAYLNQKALGDPEEVTDNLLERIRKAIVAEAQLSLLEGEVQWIFETLGGDLGDARPHRFKTAKFAIPSTCQYCEGKVFGLSGLICQPCGFVCHSKCEPKVPANCRAAPAQKQTLPDLDASSKRSSIAPPNTTRATASAVSATTSHAKSSSQPLRHTLKPSKELGGASSSASQRILEAAAMAGGGAASDRKRSVKATYAFDASSSDEVSMAEGEVLEVLDDNDQSTGWMKVRCLCTGSVGFVPANYVSDLGDAGRVVEAASDESDVGDEVISRVRALYAYAAREAGELSLIEGEEYHLTARGFDYGSGWCEGRSAKTGATGVFPANYVETL